MCTWNWKMSQFSSHEAVSLEKHIDTQENIIKTSNNEIDNVYEIEKCVKWILDNNYEKVWLCL